MKKQMARKFCKKCEYNLRGLTDHVCPECGQGFDPEIPETFSKYGPNVLIDMYRRIDGLFMLAMFMGLVVVLPVVCVVVLCLLVMELSSIL